MTLSEYSQLKQQVLFSVHSSERHNKLLNTLKEMFRDDINSKRRYEQINTIGQLLHVLEIRDVLSEDNVTPLKKITEILSNNEELLKKIVDYETSHVPREYVNYYVTENIQDTSTREQSETIINNSPVTGVLSKRKKQQLIQTLTEEIGTFWRDLGRNLKMRECIIEDIDNLNISITNKASKLIEEFERRADPQRWFFVLCDALERTRRKDLSRALQDIMARNI